jgi:hypothetical protein
MLVRPPLTECWRAQRQNFVAERASARTPAQRTQPVLNTRASLYVRTSQRSMSRVRDSVIQAPGGTAERFSSPCQPEPPTARSLRGAHSLHVQLLAAYSAGRCAHGVCSHPAAQPAQSLDGESSPGRPVTAGVLSVATVRAASCCAAFDVSLPCRGALRAVANLDAPAAWNLRQRYLAVAGGHDHFLWTAPRTVNPRAALAALLPYCVPHAAAAPVMLRSCAADLAASACSYLHA